MSLDLDPTEAEARVVDLTDADDALMALVPTGESKAAAYYLAVVERPHPSEEDSVVLMERYVQLAAQWSDMSDTWLKNGINRRVEAGNGGLAQTLAQTYAQVAAQQEAGTVGERATAYNDPEA
jgi:hypothetical protein